MLENVNCYEKRRVQMKFFQATLATIFWQFTVLPCKFDLPQLKRDLISSVITLVYGSPYERNNLRLGIL